MESILTSIKKLLGPEEEYTHFDPDLIMHINSTLAILTQLGVGPPEGFLISDSSATWSDFLGTDSRLGLVKSYVYMKVKLIFDPPSSSAAIESMKNIIQEFEWRIEHAVDSAKPVNEEG